MLQTTQVTQWVRSDKNEKAKKSIGRGSSMTRLTYVRKVWNKRSPYRCFKITNVNEPTCRHFINKCMNVYRYNRLTGHRIALCFSPVSECFLYCGLELYIKNMEKCFVKFLWDMHVTLHHTRSANVKHRESLCVTCEVYLNCVSPSDMCVFRLWTVVHTFAWIIKIQLKLMYTKRSEHHSLDVSQH